MLNSLIIDLHFENSFGNLILNSASWMNQFPRIRKNLYFQHLETLDSSLKMHFIDFHLETIS